MTTNAAPALRFNRPIGFGLAAGALFVLLLSGCSEDAREAAATGNAREAQPRSEVVYASMKDIRDINPHLYMGEMSAQAMVFEPLVVNTPEGVKPALAESWTLSPDGRTYTFSLRKGVAYTDGEPFTAESVVKNFEAIVANRTRHAWLDMVNEIDTFEALDEHTFRLTLKHAYFPALVELALSRPFRFISPKCFKDGATKGGVSCYAGTGPWRLTEHVRDEHALFERNADYWGEKPVLERVRWVVMPDAQTMLMALEKGEVDLIFGADGDQLTSEALSMIGEKGAEKGLAAELSEPIASRTVLLNSNRAPTSDKNVREALQLAFDRQAVVSGVLNGIESPAETLFAKNVPGCDVELAVRPFDRAAAEKRLDAAGWTRDADGLRVKDGQTLKLRFVFNAKNTQEKSIAETIQANYAELGVAVELQGEEKQTYLDRVRAGDFELAYSLSWGAPYDPQSFLSSWREPAHGDYQAQLGIEGKAEIDAAIGRYLIENDEAKRNAILRELLVRIHDSAVYLPISYSRTKAVHSMKLENVGFAVTQYEIPFEKMRFAAPKRANE